MELDPAPDPETHPETLDARIAARLRGLRAERGWSLSDLAERSGVSRASLSRLENAETSPTAAALGRICAAYGITVSRLMQAAEAPRAHVPAAEQPDWTDPETGFRRRLLSPPAPGLAGEAVEARLPPGTRIAYDAPPRPGLEHHLLLREGALTVTLGGAAHALRPGDALRYALHGPSAFETPPETGARYILFLV
ncbi:helix-turn-helix domain-containing protein [Rhodovulum sp. DZ06]|uniref:helix-turn-helix domain-containing protein n=1 Tax=Rhodovulum sp. DZ06 TaxID=3425126 RepID=UPI003D355E64